MTNRLLHSVAYVRIPTSTPIASSRFATEILGLQPVEGESSDLRFRTDDRFQTIVMTCTPQSEARLGIEVTDHEALDAAAATLTEAGFPWKYASDDECCQREVKRALFTKDASGNDIELVCAPRMSARRFFPSRDAGVIGLEGVGLRSVDPDRDLFFWTKILGARISDRVGDITYLSIDSHHHRIVLYPSKRVGLLNVAIEVESFDYVMQNNYFLKERQVRIVQGPGRDVPSGQIFLHFTGPERILYSFVTGIRRFADGPPRARQFAHNREALCAWGSECLDGVEFPELMT
jgi:2,3-dihydroxy-p-cumate/2,3-dihydroxybenzoate 3,4-dioxygenase